VGYLVDSSTSKWHDSNFNPDILNSGIRNHTSDSLLYFNYFLLHTLYFALDGVQFIAQYNQQAGWYGT
jgi:hypothetical protein